jgi:hypothetical protein
VRDAEALDRRQKAESLDRQPSRLFAPRPATQPVPISWTHALSTVMWFNGDNYGFVIGNGHYGSF